MSGHATKLITFAGRALRGKMSASALATSTVMKSSSRSFWYMGTTSSRMVNSEISPKVLPITKSCGCCAFHTSGDKELVDFLQEEINLEQKNEKTPGKLPSIKGFEIQKADSAEIELVKKNGNETITVSFNVNHSVDDDVEMPDNQQQSEQEPQMQAKPSFVVEINKGGDKTLAIQCVFPPAENHAAEGEYEETVEIQDVTMVDKGCDWDDKAYTVSGSIMDGNLYDMMLTMMEERGIDADFIDALVDFSTSYEHKQYIKFLEMLQKFAASE